MPGGPCEDGKKWTKFQALTQTQNVWAVSQHPPQPLVAWNCLPRLPSGGALPGRPQAAPPGIRVRAEGQMDVEWTALCRRWPSASTGHALLAEGLSPSCLHDGWPPQSPPGQDAMLPGCHGYSAVSPGPRHPPLPGAALYLMHMHVLHRGLATSEHLTRFTNLEGNGERRRER